MKPQPHYRAANLRQQFAWNIHHVRKLLGWRQRELAAKIGMSNSQINKYENALSSPSIDVVESLAKVFLLPPPMLLCDLRQLTKEDLLRQMQQAHDCSRLRLELYAGQQLHGAAFDRMAATIQRAEKDALKVSAWRIESTLREFAPLEPINVWFDYPLHRVDDSGILNDLAAEEAAPPWQKGAKARKKKAAAKAEDSAAKFADAVSAANLGEPPTLEELANYLGIAERTCRTQIAKYGYELDKRTKLVVKKSAET